MLASFSRTVKIQVWRLTIEMIGLSIESTIHSGWTGHIARFKDNITLMDYKNDRVDTTRLDKMAEKTWHMMERYSPDAKWPYPAKACFGVIMNFYDWFILSDTSWVGIRRMPAWHPWGIFLEGKNKMATQQSVLGDVFTCKPVRNTILVSILMYSGSRNQIMMK